MAFMTFHILGIIIPTDALIFFRGVGITNQDMLTQENSARRCSIGVLFAHQAGEHLGFAVDAGSRYVGGAQLGTFLAWRHVNYPLVMTNVAMENGPFIDDKHDGLLIKNGDFPWLR